jgi:porin
LRRPRNLLAALATLLVGSFTPAAYGQLQNPGPDPDARAERLTGSWGERRTALETRGISVGGTVTFDVSRLRGASGAGEVVGRALLDANATLDLGPLAGFPGATIFLQYYGKVGGDPSEFLGEAQGFSNIDAPDFSGIGEAWLEVRFLGDRWRAKAGRIDANTEFAALHASEEFANSSMGFSPTIWGMPTYPLPGTGALAEYSPGEHVQFSVGAFERLEFLETRQEHAGWMWLAQTKVSWVGAGQRDGVLSVGAWHHTGRVASFDGPGRNGATGPFVTLEQTVWREEGRAVGDETSRHLHLFLQYGLANPVVSEVASHVGGGMAFRAPFSARRGDMLGFGVSQVSLSEFGPEGPGAREVLAGPFYLFELTPAITLKPDVQWLRQVRGGHVAHTGVLATCRVILEF